MNKSIREFIDFISKPAMIKQMRTFLSDTSTERMKALHYEIVMVRNRHEDAYYIVSPDYTDSVYHRMTVGAFYRHRHHRYFKHGRPRKLRKAK